MKMRLLTICVAAVVTLTCAEQVLMARSGDHVQNGQQKSKPSPTVYEMTVSPKAPPVPALKYSLLPGLFELKEGSAVPLYNIAVDQSTLDYAKKRRELSDILDLPISKFPVEKVRRVLAEFAAAVKYTEYGARRKECQWGLVFEEGLSMALPALNKHLHLVNLLALKARLAIAEGRSAGAIEAIKSGYAMARHLNGETLIQALVGTAAANTMTSQVRDLIQSDDSLNLYWALARLPSPIVDMRRGLESERIMFLGRGESVLEKDPLEMTDEEVQLAKQTLDEVLAAWGIRVRNQVVAFAFIGYPKGKQALIALGMDPKKVAKMSVARVMLFYELDAYRKWRDEMFKWLALPYWQAAEGMHKSSEAFSKWRKGAGKGNLLVTFLPAVTKARFLEAKADRSIRVLQCIEAVRAYAAAHEGKLPAKLADITGTPSPMDPVTGKPFEYKVVAANRFELICIVPKWQQQKYSSIYKITVRSISSAKGDK